MGAPLGEAARRIDKWGGVGVLEHELEHERPRVVEAHIHNRGAGENTNAFAELRCVVGLRTVIDRGGPRGRQLAAIDGDVPAGQPVGRVRFEVAYVRRVGPLRDFIRESAVYRAIRAKSPAEVESEEVRLHIHRDGIGDGTVQSQFDGVQPGQIRCERRREGGGLLDGGAAALWEVGELPQIARVVLGRRTAPGQRDGRAQLDGLIRPCVHGGRRSGWRR